MAIPNIYIIATYEVTDDRGVVRLEQFVGDQTESGPQEANERTWARGTTIKQQIETACTELQLDLRGGELMEVPA